MKYGVKFKSVIIDKGSAKCQLDPGATYNAPELSQSKKKKKKKKDKLKGKDKNKKAENDGEEVDEDISPKP